MRRNDKDTVENDENDSCYERGGYKIFTPANVIIITGASYPELAQGVAELLNIELALSASRHPDNEAKIEIPANIRGRDVFVIQTLTPPNQDGYFVELMFILDAVRRASAGKITAVLPYMAYQRQDKKNRSRVPIGAAVIAQALINSGADRLITVDNHSPQQQGYINAPWDELFASHSLSPVIRDLGLTDVTVLSPDTGGLKRADYYLHLIGAQDLASIYKQRSRDGRSNSTKIIGEVSGKDVLIIDDLIASGSTIFDAAKLAKKDGAKRIIVAATHGLFLGNFTEKLDNSPIEKILITNTLPYEQIIIEHPKIQIVDITNLLSEAIKRTVTGDPLSELFPKFDTTI
jgi:ribose-phosphate pyrophosphokinase